ncbi:hypothetical protein BJ742DRAFT_199153 [Cladochytrium replicatum]|nr:hypothetical protein BJ742DRAFT_199153 [Cladochytrium replicatum]
MVLATTSEGEDTSILCNDINNDEDALLLDCDTETLVRNAISSSQQSKESEASKKGHSKKRGATQDSGIAAGSSRNSGSQSNQNGGRSKRAKTQKKTAQESAVPKDSCDESEASSNDELGMTVKMNVYKDRVVLAKAGWTKFYVPARIVDVIIDKSSRSSKASKDGFKYKAEYWTGHTKTLKRSEFYTSDDEHFCSCDMEPAEKYTALDNDAEKSSKYENPILRSAVYVILPYLQHLLSTGKYPASLNSETSDESHTQYDFECSRFKAWCSNHGRNKASALVATVREFEEHFDKGASDLLMDEIYSAMFPDFRNLFGKDEGDFDGDLFAGSPRQVEKMVDVEVKLPETTSSNGGTVEVAKRKEAREVVNHSPRLEAVKEGEPALLLMSESGLGNTVAATTAMDLGGKVNSNEEESKAVELQVSITADLGDNGDGVPNKVQQTSSETGCQISQPCLDHPGNGETEEKCIDPAEADAVIGLIALGTDAISPINLFPPLATETIETVAAAADSSEPGLVNSHSISMEPDACAQAEGVDHVAVVGGTCQLAVNEIEEGPAPSDGPAQRSVIASDVERAAQCSVPHDSETHIRKRDHPDLDKVQSASELAPPPLKKQKQRLAEIRPTADTDSPFLTHSSPPTTRIPLNHDPMSSPSTTPKNTPRSKRRGRAVDSVTETPSRARTETLLKLIAKYPALEPALPSGQREVYKRILDLVELVLVPESMVLLVCHGWKKEKPKGKQKRGKSGGGDGLGGQSLSERVMTYEKGCEASREDRGDKGGVKVYKLCLEKRNMQSRMK